MSSVDPGAPLPKTFSKDAPVVGTGTTTSSTASMPREVPRHFGPGAMMTWLFAQMRQSDKDVQECLAQVEGDRAKLATLQELQAIFRGLKNSVFPEGGTGKVMVNETGAYNFQSLKKSDGDPDSAKLNAQPWYQALSATGKQKVWEFIRDAKDGKALEKHVDVMLDTLKDEIGSINSNNELQMISLQHVMQTRNQALQLSSNIIAAIDRAAETPINNLK
jgi:hypothetical protein